MYTTGHLDWLAATYPSSIQPNDTIPRAWVQQPFVNKGRGRYGYQTLKQNADGVIVMQDGTERMGTHLALPGSALQALRGYGMTDRTLCQYVLDNGGKVARLDAAVNIYDGTVTVQDLETAYLEGRAKTPARSGLRHKGLHRDNDGVVLGSRVSNRYFRAYDKRAEQQCGGPAWVRLELECHKLYSQAVARSMAESEHTRPVINRVLRDYFDVPGMPEYQEALSDTSDRVLEVPRKLHNRLEWLIGQVVVAASNEQDANPGMDVWAIMTSAYQAYRAAQESHRC